VRTTPTPWSRVDPSSAICASSFRGTLTSLESMNATSGEQAASCPTFLARDSPPFAAQSRWTIRSSISDRAVSLRAVGGTVVDEVEHQITVRLLKDASAGLQQRVRAVVVRQNHRDAQGHRDD
jgi:hypothetical protein